MVFVSGKKSEHGVTGGVLSGCNLLSSVDICIPTICTLCITYIFFFKTKPTHICKLRSNDTLLARKEPRENKLHIHLHNCSLNQINEIFVNSYVFSLYNELVHFLNRLTKHKRPQPSKKGSLRSAEVTKSIILLVLSREFRKWSISTSSNHPSNPQQPIHSLHLASVSCCHLPLTWWPLLTYWDTSTWRVHLSTQES